MRVLITGGAGFIGSHLIEHVLKNTDWNIVCLDRLDTSGNLNRLSEILDISPSYKKRFNFVWHDLKAEINSQVAAALNRPNYVFHLAASSHVDRSIQDPLGYIQDNVVGTANLLNYARSVDCLDYFQNFSTDEVYGCADEGVEYAEWDRHKPRNPYAATKSAADQLCYAYHVTYRLPIVVSNCMNVIGERQHPEKFLPMCINKVLKGEKIFIHSYPGNKRAGTRFYVHARNVAAACLFLVSHSTAGERYNLLGQKEVSNLELAQFVADVIGKPLEYELVDFHSNRPGHDLRYALKDTKLCTLGFKYPVPFEESLEKTIKWTLENQRWLDEIS
jgi:dTDP-glucose 4,6-dehydratase